MKKLGLGLAVITGILLLIWSFNDSPEPPSHEDIRAQWFTDPATPPAGHSDSREPCDEIDPHKRALFGNLHVHTALSSDAYAFDTRLRPDDAYAFAKGTVVKLPPNDLEGGSRSLQIETPLDFAAVTDHAEYLGDAEICLDPETEGYSSLSCRAYRGDLTLPVGELLKPMLRLVAIIIHGKNRPASICGDDGSACLERMLRPWREIQQAAESHYDRSSDCAFTSFVGYEYSLAKNASNLHRNVIFANASVPPRPISSRDAPEPDDLWRWLDESCLKNGDDCDVLAIPHNSNWSNGRMFWPQWTENASPELRQLRKTMEPLVEIFQVKGDSECRNGLAGVAGMRDEWCDFEKLRWADEAVEQCGDTAGSGGMTLKGCQSPYSFVRYALTQGLRDQERFGVNPFEFGIIADSDTHNGTPGAAVESGWEGAHGTDSSDERRLVVEIDVPGGIATGSPVRYNPGGLTGVYAEQNTRQSIFAALKRRETFGTSGPRIKPRFYAADRFPKDICDRDTIARAEASASPMGSVVNGHTAQPEFLVSAQADPKAGRLQQLQIIKGWINEKGELEQAVLTVAGNDDGHVDLDNCQRSGGQAQLCGTWRDQNFDPRQGAVYYARVLETPACRWSHAACINHPAPENLPACSEPRLPKTIQERAWTSPIWFYPS